MCQFFLLYKHFKFVLEVQIYVIDTNLQESINVHNAGTINIYYVF